MTHILVVDDEPALRNVVQHMLSSHGYHVEVAENANRVERELQARKVRGLTQDLPPLPDFSRFHDAFRGSLKDGDMRSAYFLAADEENCHYLPLDSPELDRELSGTDAPVSSKFVIPYPPGFPLLVPGQIVTPDIVEYMRKLDVKEIHGYQQELGLRLFKKEVLERRMAAERRLAEATEGGGS